VMIFIRLLTFRPDNLLGSADGWTQQTSKVVGSEPNARVETDASGVIIAVRNVATPLR